MQTTPHTLLVGLNERSYPIHIGANLLAQANTLLHNPHTHTELGQQLFIITNDVVALLYLEALQNALQTAEQPRQIEVLSLPDGEHAKRIEYYQQAMDQLIAANFNRDCAVIALGGGVVGDLAGFVAATYQRGVDFYQIPTTLLAQVDSSVGGKTAINHPAGKNLIGAFYQPQTVLIDTHCLTTLSDRDFACGMAEVIKYGIMADADFFSWLEANQTALQARDPAALQYAIQRSCELKAAVVSADEREQGQRALLNLGHTFGHAIESASQAADQTGEYWRHGEAVAVGMLIACHFMQQRNEFSKADLQRVERLLTAMNLPTQAPELSRQQWQDYMQRDKKVKAGRVRFILPTRIGAAVIRSSDDWDAIHQAIAATRATA